MLNLLGKLPAVPGGSPRFGLDEEMARAYIRNQELEDER